MGCRVLTQPQNQSKLTAEEKLAKIKKLVDEALDDEDGFEYVNETVLCIQEIIDDK